MKYLYAVWWALTLTFVLGGCATIEVHVAPLRGIESSRVADVPLLTSVPVDVYDVAILQATAVDDDLPRALAAVKRTARELGCDAVVRVRIETTGTRAHLTGYCVRYLDQYVPPDVAAEPKTPALTL